MNIRVCALIIDKFQSKCQCSVAPQTLAIFRTMLCPYVSLFGLLLYFLYYLDVLRIWDSLFADEKRFRFLICVACAMLM